MYAKAAVKKKRLLLSDYVCKGCCMGCQVCGAKTTVSLAWIVLFGICCATSCANYWKAKARASNISNSDVEQLCLLSGFWSGRSEPKKWAELAWAAVLPVGMGLSVLSTVEDFGSDFASDWQWRALDTVMNWSLKCFKSVWGEGLKENHSQATWQAHGTCTCILRKMQRDRALMPLWLSKIRRVGRNQQDSNTDL